ncbi:glycosyltransferase family A protein [uncultured Christiangramia sp.]|uniref:glycosyltransferase family 2 protein n=1 Tax=uncultured Christiangramia sp. TaxID=503836 RepID=UPI00262C6F4F|nr:glycosyltransferase family A protein [uncultured Christiangramia sp.]
MISIVIPTYNRSKLIERSINSLKFQTFNDWELIIVDDGSTDNTGEVIEPFLEDTRIRYIHKKNTGAAHSRNVGVKNSKYDYISFLDSDDEAKPDWLSKVWNEISVKKASVVCCGCETLDQDGNLLAINLPSKTKIFPDTVYKMTNGGVFSLKKEIFNQIGGFDDNLKSGQHTELSFRLIPYLKERNIEIINIQESLINIHIHKGERIRGNPEMKYEGTTYCLNKHASFFNERKSLKADYEGTVGRNAYLTGRKEDSILYFKKAFLTQPSVKRFLRIPYYIIQNLFK